MTAGSSGGGFEGDVVSESFELRDQSAGGAFGVLALEVVAAEFAVGLAGGEHVPVGDEHRVLDGDECAAVSDPGSEPLVLGLEVAVLGPGRGESGFFERDPKPLGSFAGASGASFAGGLVVAGALPGP